MISKEIVLKLFDGFSIQRWSDRVKPLILVEMDKHADKSFIAYFLGKYTEAKSTKINWEFIIYGCFFALLKNLAVSDIQAPVFDKIRNDKKISEQLNNWIINGYKNILDEDLLEKFNQFLFTDYKGNINFRILQASHKLSTYREYRIIKHANLHNPDLQEIEKRLKKSLSQFTDIAGFNELYFDQDLSDVMHIIENLRNQTRWGQSVRIPPTSVLGHSFFVAALSLLISRDLNACNKRLYNNFFCGLFHDVPEALTRDIISPVKNSTPDLPAFISKIEKNVMKTDFFPKLDNCVHGDIEYFTNMEFRNKIIENKKVIKLTKSDKLELYNSDKYNLLDGELIKLADEIAAFIEARQSKLIGINTPFLEIGYDSILKKYTRDKPIVNGINVISFFDQLQIKR